MIAKCIVTHVYIEKKIIRLAITTGSIPKLAGAARRITRPAAKPNCPKSITLELLILSPNIPAPIEAKGRIY